MSWRLIVGMVLAALVPTRPTSGADAPPPMSYRTIAITAGHFRCEVPEGWYFDRDEPAEARIHYHGFYVHGPKGNEDIGPSLSVRFFAPDNTLFAGAAGYLKRQLGPSLVKLADEKTSEPREVTVAGRPTTTFTRDTFEFFPPESLDSKRIPMREEHFVVPHLGGFVIVRFEAPTASYARSRQALSHLLETLRLLPELTLQTVRLTSPGLSPEVMEARVTNPVEAGLKGSPELLSTWSASFRGESVLSLAFKSTSDVTAVRQELQRRLAPLLGGLPAGTSTLLDPAFSGEEPVLSVTLSTNNSANTRPAQIARLTALAERTVRSRINAVPGVVQAAFTGAAPRYEVDISPERLAKHNVDLRDLIAAVRNGAKPAGGAALETPIDDFLQRAVVLSDGRQVTIGDLVEVRLTAFEPVAVDERSADKGASDADTRIVQLLVRNSPDTDYGAVYRAVERALDEVRTTLPEGVALQRRLVAPAANPVWESLGIGHGRLVLKVAGADLTAAADAAEEVRQSFASIAGVVDLAVIPAVRPTRRVAVRREQAARYGFDDKAIREIVATVETIIDRLSVARVAGPHGLPIDVAVTADGDEPAAIGRLTFQIPEGGRITLSSIAEISLVAEPAAVLHEQGRRVVLVTGRIEGRDSADAVGEIESLLRTIRLPDGLSIETLKNE